MSNGIIPIIFPLSQKVDFSLLFHRDKKHSGWIVDQDFKIILDGVKLNSIKTRFWETENNEILVKKDFFWDGTSFPGLDINKGAIASLVHDIICTKRNKQYAVSSYVLRHFLYRQIAKKQGMNYFRYEVIFFGLIFFNIFFVLRDH